MKLDLFAEQRTTATPVGLMVAARIANMLVGLAIIPVLIHTLGGEGFAAWAVLLAVSAAFTLLEVGMPKTFIRYAAPLIQQGQWQQVATLLAHVLTVLGLVFVAGIWPVSWLASEAAGRLKVPNDGLLSAAQMILFVYAAIALRALLQFGSLTFNAARRFRAYAVASFLQSFLSNVAAAAVAIWTGRLDLTLLAFWIAQLLLLALSSLIAIQRFARDIAITLPRLDKLRELCSHGLKVQAFDWAQILTFQFDKLLIATFMGLWAVAPYEVGFRGVAALRSVPSSGLDSFLATAAIGHHEGSDELWRRYRSATQLAALSVLVFLIAPLAVAPIFLYAWTGEMGYYGRWVFLSLSLGAACSVIVLPAATLAQAAGRVDLQARSALASLLLNIPLSFILLLEWGLAGVAAGTALSLLAGSFLLLLEVHRAYRQSLPSTLKMLAALWPLVAVCAACALLANAPFEIWLSSLPRSMRYAWQVRLVPGLFAGLGYLVCVSLMAATLIHRGALADEHYEILSRLIRFRWFQAWCDKRRESR